VHLETDEERPRKIGHRTQRATKKISVQRSAYSGQGIEVQSLKRKEQSHSSKFKIGGHTLLKLRRIFNLTGWGILRQAQDARKRTRIFGSSKDAGPVVLCGLKKLVG